MNFKLLSRISVVLVLVGFPLISWLYLGMGIDYRKAMLKKLSPKNEISAFNIQVDSATIISSKELYQYTSLVCLVSSDSSKILDLIPTAVNQLDGRTDFRIMLLHNQIGICTNDNPKLKCHRINNEILNGIKLKNLGFAESYSNNVVALVDTALNVRRYYDMDSVDIQEIYEDLVFILPPEPENNVAIKQ